jgi:hypothetical protein
VWDHEGIGVGERGSQGSSSLLGYMETSPAGAHTPPPRGDSPHSRHGPVSATSMNVATAEVSFRLNKRGRLVQARTVHVDLCSGAGWRSSLKKAGVHLRDQHVLGKAGRPRGPLNPCLWMCREPACTGMAETWWSHLQRQRVTLQAGAGELS